MGQFTFFLASSTEQLTLASDIADALGKLDHRAIRWWTSFDPSAYNLEALEAALRQADAGIFLCIGDDTGKIRDAEVKVPRDNVILELGLFLGVLGRRRCFIVADSDTGLRLPSDLAGITRLDASRDADWIASTVTKNVAKSIESEPRKTKNGCIHIRADGGVTMKITQSRLPAEWHQRALYYGTEGAKAWLAYSDDEYTKVQTTADQLADADQTIAALGRERFRTFVSLGPGDARRDKQVYEQLRTSNGPVQYIPVDISDSLIHYAVGTLVSVGAPVPFGLLADFEDGQDFLFDNLKGLPQPRLFTLLGNTLGNLDIGAESFLRQFAGRMKRGDQLLLDVTTTEQEWTFDPYKRYFTSPIRKEFIAQGIARQLGVSTHEILGRFEDRIAAKRAERRPDHAEQQLIYDKETGKIGLTLRAYYFDRFRNWIDSNTALKVEYAEQYQFEGVQFGAGLIRLSKQ
jgi:hypothetical protein